MENLKENKIKKETRIKFGRKRYFLGVRKEDNKKIYLTEATWDCGWYWGFGYVNSFKKGDIYDHQHFDTLFLKKNIFDSFKNYFVSTPLTNDEIYFLLSYMKEFYIMQKYAELLQYGGYIIVRAISILEEKNKDANKKEVERINNNLIPELLEKIYKLLEG